MIEKEKRSLLSEQETSTSVLYLQSDHTEVHQQHRCLKPLKKHVLHCGLSFSCTLFSISYHTLVLTESKKVYSFGCNEQGQLGRGEETQASVPLPVQLPHGKYIYLNRRVDSIYNYTKITVTIK